MRDNCEWLRRVPRRELDIQPRREIVYSSMWQGCRARSHFIRRRLLTRIQAKSPVHRPIEIETDFAQLDQRRALIARQIEQRREAVRQRQMREFLRRRYRHVRN